MGFRTDPIAAQAGGRSYDALMRARHLAAFGAVVMVTACSSLNVSEDPCAPPHRDFCASVDKIKHAASWTDDDALEDPFAIAIASAPPDIGEKMQRIWGSSDATLSTASPDAVAVNEYVKSHCGFDFSAERYRSGGSCTAIRFGTP